MSTKGFFGRKDNTIHSGEGPISAIKWRGNIYINKYVSIS